MLRHGQTEWSAAGNHTGRTDVPLTARGVADAAALAPMLARRKIVAVFISPAQRAVRTAQLAGLAGLGDLGDLGGRAGADGPGPDGGLVKQDPDLWEWDYGGYEGMTTDQIRQQLPGWNLWRDGVIPGDAAHPGETAEEVGARADRVLARASGFLADGDVALVSHGHLLRVLTARWLGLPAVDGRLFRLDTGTVSTLGYEREEHVILTWNVPSSSSS